MAQLWGKKQQKTLLKSSVVYGVSLFSSLAVFPKKSEKQKIVERRKKASMPSLSFSTFLSILPNASLTVEDRKHFERNNV